MPYNRFQVQTDGEVTEVHLVDSELSDLLIQTELQEELVRLVAELKPQKVLVDFTPVRYCTSAAINAMLDLRRRVHQAQGKIVLCGMSKHVRDSFRILNLDGTLFKIYSTVPDAKAALN